MHPTEMVMSSSGGPNETGSKSGRVWIIVIGCLILLALGTAMLMRSGGNRPTLPNAGPGSHTGQR